MVDTETLSDKITKEFFGNMATIHYHTPMIEARNVKKFIRKLKEELIMLYDTEKHINELVDKLAGNKLI